MRSSKIDSGYFSSVKWGTFAIGLSFLRQIFLIPVFIITVGSYGLSFWLILSTIVVMITSLSLGHLHYSANLLNFISYKKDNPAQEMAKIQGVNVVYAVVQLILGLVICYTPVLSFISGFPEDYITSLNAGVSLILLLSGKMLLQYVSMFTLRFFEPSGRISTTLKYQAIGEASDLLITLIVIYFTGSIFYTCLAVFVLNLAFSSAMMLYVANSVPYSTSFTSRINFKGVNNLIRGSSALNTSFLIEKIYDVGLNLVVVRVFGAAVVPIFSTSRVLTNIFYRICTVMVLPLFPVIQKEYAQNNQDSIVSKIKIFWSLLSVVIIFCITAGMPFIPYAYNLWTHNQLQFNLNIICFLFMAVSFQNFAMIINEFLKKNNLSRQILVVNALKSVVTIIALILFGHYDYLPGLGIALLVAEVVCATYSINVLLNVFKNKITLPFVMKYLMPVVLFCVSLSIYLYRENYLLFLLCNSIILAFFISKNGIFKTIKTLYKW